MRAGGIKFTWDTRKEAANERKHGVNFEEARTVFDDAQALRIFDTDHSEDEDRFLLPGSSCLLRLIVVSHYWRGQDELVRIISARKASKNEAATYNERIK